MTEEIGFLALTNKGHEEMEHLTFTSDMRIDHLTQCTSRYLIDIITHLKLCLATAIHNFKWVIITIYLFNLRSNIYELWCLNTDFIYKALFINNIQWIIGKWNGKKRLKSFLAANGLTWAKYAIRIFAERKKRPNVPILFVLGPCIYVVKAGYRQQKINWSYILW